MSDRPQPQRLPPYARLMLAALFGLLTIGVVGMHLLSADHQLADPALTQHGAHGSVTAAAAHDPTHGGTADVSGMAIGQPVMIMTGADAGGHGCADCDHVMMAGSCLLALVFGILWRLLAPAAGRSWSVRRVRSATAADVLARLRSALSAHRIALTPVELSICRT